ncbi:MAG: hypothetical protein AAFY71_23440 [Bacteroidota bacterium]
MKLYFLSLLIPLFAFLSCRQVQGPEIEFSLMGGKKLFSLDEATHSYVDDLNGHKLYIHTFQVDYNEDVRDAVPLSTLPLVRKKETGKKVVPVIKLSNRLFLQCDSTQLASLGKRISQHLNLVTDSLSLRELVVDCEWSPDTREAYFNVLQDIRTSYDPGIRELSAVVPLHYFRYQDTVGRPPVDKVFLRLVNTLDIAAYGENLSPIEAEFIRPYLMNLMAYGTKVEIMVPLGNWGLLVRNKKPVVAFPTITQHEIEGQGEFSQVSNVIKVEENAYFKGQYLRKGDFIRLTPYSNQHIKDLWNVIKAFNRLDTLDICLVDYDPSFPERYPASLLKRWFSDLNMTEK